MGFDAERMQNALGIAGSLSGGLMEFARSGTGAMVKRLHLGRAAESGVLAASLAADGFTGPVSVLEGELGFLNVFCGDYDAAELTRGLGETYETRVDLLKRFACHVTAQTSRAGDPGIARRARLRRRRRRLDPDRRQRQHGDDQQHHRSRPT